MKYDNDIREIVNINLKALGALKDLKERSVWKN